MVKKVILNADGLGGSKAINTGVLEGYDASILKSASIIANGSEFENAVNVVLPNCKNLDIGIHLNLTQGLSICSDIDTLTDDKMNFSNSFFSLLLKAYNPKIKDFLPQVEREFRRQIEKVMSKTQVTHIDSYQHIHAIPPIFEIVCRLAKEYKINEVRTHFEQLYFVPEPYRNFKIIYYKNFLKKILLNFFSIINENTILKYNLKTNNYLIGTSYEANMDSLSVSYGIQAIKNNNATVEIAIHPCRYEEGTIDNHFDEYMITRNMKLKNKLEKLGYEITNYVEEDS